MRYVLSKKHKKSIWKLSSQKKSKKKNHHLEMATQFDQRAEKNNWCLSGGTVDQCVLNFENISKNPSLVVG